MHVWLIHPSEPLPTDPGARLFRYGLLAQSLTAGGHTVTQWASTFNHFTKQQRADRDTSSEFSPGYFLELLYGRSYHRHASWERIQFNKEVAAAFRRRSAETPRPDVIVCSIPTLELADEAIRYGRAHGVQVLLDIRDLWPDVFLTAVPRPLRWLARPLLAPWVAQVQRLCAAADGLLGVSQDYLDWGLRHADRAAGPHDGVFTHGYRRRPLIPETRAAVAQRWEMRGLRASRHLRCCYFGTLGKSSGVDLLLKAARQLDAAGVADIEFIVCGKGPREARYLRAAHDLPNVRFLGWVSSADIELLMEWSDVGLALYDGDVLQSLPNKPIEYVAGGLPVLSTLPGELATLLTRYDCGRTLGTRDVTGLAETLHWLASERQELKRLGENATALYKARFDADVVYPALMRHLENIVSPTRKQRVA